MQPSKSLAALAAAIGILAFASQSFALAALANGAKTSAKPTSTNPTQKQMQIAADPLGILDFQFTMTFNPDLVSVATDSFGVPLITTLNGYDLGFRGSASDNPAYVIDNQLGEVTVCGYWPASGGTVPTRETDVFAVTFQLNDGLDLTTVLDFQVLGLDAADSLYGPSSPDYMNAGTLNTDGSEDISRVYTAGDPNNPIFSSDTGPVAIVPEPATMAALLPLPLLLARRSRR
jgi:hypothetical protein